MSEEDEKSLREIRKSEDSGYFYAKSKSQKTDKKTTKSKDKD